MSNYKKPELVEKAEEQVGSDLGSAFSFLGKALNAVLGEDDPSYPSKLPTKPSSVNQSISKPQIHCNTCGGTGQIGRLGYEIPCSVCKPNDCTTCKGSGKLGAEGFEIDCPMCQIRK